jgi:excinuclease ABC subunit C
MDLKAKVKSFPDKPGVYLMKASSGEVIYVGKALSLRKRVRSYFDKNPFSVKTQVMMEAVKDISFIETVTEHEALILESELVKRHQPRFNILLKDDKSFPYIKITQERFPRVFIGRRKKNETGYDYFGPYTQARLLRRALKILRKGFPFRACRCFPKRPCLYFDLGLCLGPCAGRVTQEKYRGMIRRLEAFLVRKDAELIEDLSRRMRACVRAEKFEQASAARDQLEALGLLIFLKKIDARGVLASEDDWQRLGFKSAPRRIEAFDISQLAGQQPVGSLVSFYNGEPDKDHYRRFKIRTVAGIDDYAMMREVVRRRLWRLKEKRLKFPDLILIDGGLGHLEAARAVCDELGVKIPLTSIAKKEELIYTVEHKRPLRFKPDSPVLRLVMRARDEAHRFAVRYHHLLREKDAFGK